MIPVLGIGCIFAGGEGVESLERTLSAPYRAPRPRADGKGCAFTTDLAAVKDGSLLKRIRRADKLSKMCVVAASGAMADAGSGAGPGAGTGMGIILATSLGPHQTTFDFLNDILDFGDINVSPTRFSNSVHNAAASYVAETLGLRCPTLTVTRFFDSFHEALVLAGCWIAEGRCSRVLVGAADQYGDVLKYVMDAKLTPAPDGIIRPFNLKPTFQVPGEGAVFLLLGDPGARGARGAPGAPGAPGRREPYCGIEAYPRGNPGGPPVPPDLRIIDADGLLADETRYAREASDGVPVAAYSPHFGSMMVGSAFGAAVAALALRNRKFYPNPVADNPRGLNIAQGAMKGDFGVVECVRYNCQAEKAVIILKRGG